MGFVLGPSKGGKNFWRRFGGCNVRQGDRACIAGDLRGGNPGTKMPVDNVRSRTFRSHLGVHASVSRPCFEGENLDGDRLVAYQCGA